VVEGQLAVIEEAAEEGGWEREKEGGGEREKEGMACSALQLDCIAAALQL
jgi:hypothetical protein